MQSRSVLLTTFLLLVAVCVLLSLLVNTDAAKSRNKNKKRAVAPNKCVAKCIEKYISQTMIQSCARSCPVMSSLSDHEADILLSREMADTILFGINCSGSKKDALKKWLQELWAKITQRAEKIKCDAKKRLCQLQSQKQKCPNGQKFVISDVPNGKGDHCVKCGCECPAPSCAAHPCTGGKVPFEQKGTGNQCSTCECQCPDPKCDTKSCPDGYESYTKDPTNPNECATCECRKKPCSAVKCETHTCPEGYEPFEESDGNSCTKCSCRKVACSILTCEISTSCLPGEQPYELPPVGDNCPTCGCKCPDFTCDSSSCPLGREAHIIPANSTYACNTCECRCPSLSCESKTCLPGQQPFVQSPTGEGCPTCGCKCPEFTCDSSSCPLGREPRVIPANSTYACETCECKCPDPKCDANSCPDGYESYIKDPTNPNECATCECRKKPCPVVKCETHTCPVGMKPYKKEPSGENECPTCACECVPPSCTCGTNQRPIIVPSKDTSCPTCTCECLPAPTCTSKDCPFYQDPILIIKDGCPACGCKDKECDGGIPDCIETCRGAPYDIVERNGCLFCRCQGGSLYDSYSWKYPHYSRRFSRRHNNRSKHTDRDLVERLNHVIEAGNALLERLRKERKQQMKKRV